MKDFLKYDDTQIFKYDNLILAVIYTIGHILVAMTCNRIITGASLDMAAADAFVEPIINGFWFYFLLVYLKNKIEEGLINKPISFLKNINVGIYLAVIYTIGHILIAMTCNRLLTGAPLNLAVIDAFIEPIVNGFWFYLLFEVFNKYKQKYRSSAAGKSSKNPSSSMNTSKLGPIIKKNNLDLKDLNGSGEDGKITKNDVLEMINNSSKVTGREYTSKKMSSLRRKIATRLVAVKNETAMLTTFNEVDMSSIMNLRSEFKQKFIDKHDINLGFMSFFTKAVTTALLDFPDVNAMIEGENIIHFNYMDIGIAVSAPKGLMVPVVRNAQDLTFKDVESEIKRLAIKARDGKITVDEMLGGTFTITNGGVFGSMLSTPIINPPQSAILGMHNIVERPVVINGKVVVRPIMYLALSYDHRIIDGKSSVGFLCKVKECLEDPKQYLMNNNIQKALEL